MMSRKRLMLSLLAAGFAWAGYPPKVGGDVAAASAANHPPHILELNASVWDVAVNGTATLTATATDPDGDSLTYSWATTQGSIEGHGGTALWTAPAEAVRSTITVTVADGRGEMDRKTAALSSHDNSPRAILVDASHDGGVWWSPQLYGRSFSAAEPHQGRTLAEFVRANGFQVDELPRGLEVTETLLNQYDKVIRATGFGPYSGPELQAYAAFLKRPTSLVLIADFLRSHEKDGLAELLGIPLAGIARGTVARFAPHPITEGMMPLSYMAGSVVIDPASNPSIEVLGWLSDRVYVDLNDNGFQDASEPTGGAVMGILHHPTARIFFLGDLNGIEAVPEPFASNLIHWAFDPELP